jgi:hypothetical protein
MVVREEVEGVRGLDGGDKSFVTEEAILAQY